NGNAFVHLEDLDQAFIQTVEKRYELPHELTLNISESKTYSYEELQDFIGERIHHKEWKTFEIPKPLAKVGAWAQDLVSDPFIKQLKSDSTDKNYEMENTRGKKYLDSKHKHD